jgi:hypothetical protein
MEKGIGMEQGIKCVVVDSNNIRIKSYMFRMFLMNVLNQESEHFLNSSTSNTVLYYLGMTDTQVQQHHVKNGMDRALPILNPRTAQNYSSISSLDGPSKA